MGNTPRRLLLPTVDPSSKQEVVVGLGGERPHRNLGGKSPLNSKLQAKGFAGPVPTIEHMFVSSNPRRGQAAQQPRGAVWQSRQTLRPRSNTTDLHKQAAERWRHVPVVAYESPEMLRCDSRETHGGNQAGVAGVVVRHRFSLDGCEV